MNRNPKNKHLKRINAPKHWLLDKLSGVWVSSNYIIWYLHIYGKDSQQNQNILYTNYEIQAPRPSPGPHKLRECLPIIVMLRNRLKYALTGKWL